MQDPRMSCCSSKPVALANACETLLSKCEIPIIDLAHVGTERCPQKGVVKQVGTKLVQALAEKGLALLVNHGIPDCKLKAVYRKMDEFCELPEETRCKYERNPKSNHGYVKPGMERLSENEVEVRHSFNVMSTKELLPEEEVPGFTHVVEELARDFKQLATMLLTALAVGLEHPPDFLQAKHTKIMEGEGNDSTLRLLYYPPLNACEPGVTRCGPHADYGTFTLLAQDCEGGLEVQTPRTERWSRVGHLPGAILVQSAEILSCWTNEALPALRHRVVVPELCGRGRRSIAFFVHPDYDVDVEPFATKQLPGCGVGAQSSGDCADGGAEAAAAGAAAAAAGCGSNGAGAGSTSASAPCRLQKKKKGGVITAYQHLQRRFRETYAS